MLRVRRGVTYTFIVEAGDDVNDGPNYHPFYITNSIDGGILLDTPEQRTVSVNMITREVGRGGSGGFRNPPVIIRLRLLGLQQDSNAPFSTCSASE